MQDAKRVFSLGLCALAVFVLWTFMLQMVDVEMAGESMSYVGLSKINVWFHRITNVHMWLYYLTDWLGLVPVFVCMGFGVLGLAQLISRRSLLKVDLDILLLGIYYIVVILCYLTFEMVPLNYRPILIQGRLEASYPSSTTLLTLCVMPTLTMQIGRRCRRQVWNKIVPWVSNTFATLMVVGRLISGVHWLTDIIGAICLSCGLFCIYKGSVLLWCKREIGDNNGI